MGLIKIIKKRWHALLPLMAIVIELVEYFVKATDSQIMFCVGVVVFYGFNFSIAANNIIKKRDKFSLGSKCIIGLEIMASSIRTIQVFISLFVLIRIWIIKLIEHAEIQKLQSVLSISMRLSLPVVMFMFYTFENLGLHILSLRKNDNTPQTEETVEFNDVQNLENLWRHILSLRKNDNTPQTEETVEFNDNVQNHATYARGGNFYSLKQFWKNQEAAGKKENESNEKEIISVLVEPSKSSSGGLSASKGVSKSCSSDWIASTRGVAAGLTGLLNLGNTCFMNSAIQCLVHTPEFARFFREDYFQEINWHNPLGMEGELALAFGELLRKLWAPGRKPVDPRLFKAKLDRFAPQFSGYNQHDSQELLALLLDGLHEGLNRVKDKPYIKLRDADGRPDEEVADEFWANHIARNDSIIVDACQGQYKSTLVCPECNKISVTFDPFMYLSLPLQSTTSRTEPLSLYTCLEAFLREEQLVPEDMWYCPQCKEQRQAIKKLDLWRLPEVLVIHLKRFSYSRSMKQKLETFVNFPIHDFDLTKYVANKNSFRPQLYELYALTNHYGDMGSGHYTAHIKLLDENKWYNFDDSHISFINEEDGKSGAAYVLFYRRVKTDDASGDNGAVA